MARVTDFTPSPDALASVLRLIGALVVPVSVRSSSTSKHLISILLNVMRSAGGMGVYAAVMRYPTVIVSYILLSFS